MTTLDSTTSPVNVEPPGFSTEAVAAAVVDKYGLQGNYSQLVSERDQNFRLKTPDGRRFVVKVTGLIEDSVATDFQLAMLSHFEKNEFHYAPQIVRAISGDSRSAITSDSGQQYSLRVVTWLEGNLLHDIGISEENSGRFGRCLADLDLSLESFEFEGDGQAGLWDMQNVLQLEALLPHVTDDDVRRYASDVLTRFGDTALAALRKLPKQAIHNDANPENILFDESGEVSGFIDFGDSLRAPRIIEVAIAASYLRADGENPLKYIEAFVAGYHSRNPLTSPEFELLFDLISTRLATTLIILYWRLSARDEDDPYRQKTLENESNAFEFLALLSALGREAFDRRINERVRANPL